MGAYVGPAPAGFPNVALSNFAKDWRDQKYVGDLICPRVPVNRQSFPYVIHSQDDYRIPATTLRAPGARPNSFRHNYSTGTYFAGGHSLETDIPFESETYALGLGFSARKRATASLTKRLNLAREAQIAAAALSTINFPNGTSLSNYALWDAYITSPANDVSNPLTDVENAKEALREVGIDDDEMALILSSPVVKILVNHPKVVDRFKYTNTLGVIDLQKLSSVFGVECVRAGAVSLTENNVKSWVWGNNAFLGYAQPAPDQEDLSCMKTFSWTGQGPDGTQSSMVAAGADGWAVLEWIEPHLSEKKYWQSAEWYYDTKVTAQEAGYPILNVCSGDTMELVASEIEG